MRESWGSGPDRETISRRGRHAGPPPPLGRRDRFAGSAVPPGRAPCPDEDWDEGLRGYRDDEYRHDDYRHEDYRHEDYRHDDYRYDRDFRYEELDDEDPGADRFGGSVASGRPPAPTEILPAIEDEAGRPGGDEESESGVPAEGVPGRPSWLPALSPAGIGLAVLVLVLLGLVASRLIMGAGESVPEGLTTPVEVTTASPTASQPEAVEGDGSPVGPATSGPPVSAPSEPSTDGQLPAAEYCSDLSIDNGAAGSVDVVVIDGRCASG